MAEKAWISLQSELSNRGEAGSGTAAAVSIRGLRKSFGAVEVLSGVDLEVPRGSIFGFLGPNGAGKTTTIRSLLGLVAADAGEMYVLEKRVPAALVALRGRIGAVVDHAALYPPLSGRQNLLVAADLLGARIAKTRIDATLESVGLTRDGDRRVAEYSYGMRQRLAVAIAILSEPDLLILDEPANGLDPSGQRELRERFGELRSAGVTLFISSHLLAEVEMVCDHIAILDRGRLVAQGPTGDLMPARDRWEVDPGDATASAAADILRAAGMVIDSQEPLVVRTQDPAWISYRLAQDGIWMRGLRPARNSLEDVFIEVTSPLGHSGPWERPA